MFNPSSAAEGAQLVWHGPPLPSAVQPAWPHRASPISWPLSLLCLCLDHSFPESAGRSLTSLRPLLGCHPLRDVFPGHRYKTPPPAAHSLTPNPAYHHSPEFCSHKVRWSPGCVSVRISFEVLAWARTVTGNPKNPSPKLPSQRDQVRLKLKECLALGPATATFSHRDFGLVAGYLQVCSFHRAESIMSVTSGLL